MRGEFLFLHVTVIGKRLKKPYKYTFVSKKMVITFSNYFILICCRKHGPLLNTLSYSTVVLVMTFKNKTLYDKMGEKVF